MTIYPGPTPEDLNPEDPETEADDILRDRVDHDDQLELDPSPVPPWTLHNRQPWERQHREPLTAYEAFTLYRDMGTHRNLTTVALNSDPRPDARNRNPTRQGRDRRSVGRWSSRWRWVERCRLWDEHRHAILIDEHEQQVRSVAQRHGEVGRRLQQMAVIRMVGRPPTDMSPGVPALDPAVLTALDVVRFLRYGTSIEVKSLELATPAERRAAATEAVAAASDNPGAWDSLVAEAEALLAEIEAGWEEEDGSVNGHSSNGRPNGQVES